MHKTASTETAYRKRLHTQNMSVFYRTKYTYLCIKQQHRRRKQHALSRPKRLHTHTCRRTYTIRLRSRFFLNFWVEKSRQKNLFVFWRQKLPKSNKIFLIHQCDTLKSPWNISKFLSLSLSSSVFDSAILRLKDDFDSR